MAEHGVVLMGDVATKEDEAVVCAREGDKTYLKAMLDSNVDVNCHEHNGQSLYTPLMWAAHRGHLDCVELLLEYKAQVNRQCASGEPALTLAAYYNHADCMQLLLEHKAGINLRDNNGRSALIKASRSGKVECVVLLLEAKADVNLLDNYGKSAMEQRMPFGIRPQRKRVNFLLHCCGAVSETEQDATFDQKKEFVAVYHTELTDVLSNAVIVDRRIGQKQNGLYHEPLERVLQYCGLDLVMEGDPNIQQDDPIPMLLRGSGRATSAKYWWDQMHANDKPQRNPKGRFF